MKPEKKRSDLTFGQAIRNFRLEKGLSQTALAKIIGISSQSLCDIENGRRTPSSKRAAIIARQIGGPETLLVRLALQHELKRRLS
ncbi:helix-turn-helix transcriptional regulator [Desulfatiferula olefinivorans]